MRAALGDARHMLAYWARAEHREAAAVLQTGLHASVSAYPQVIAVAATLLTTSAQLEHIGRPTPSGAVALLINRMNERIAAQHIDKTPVEQWVQRSPARR